MVHDHVHVPVVIVEVGAGQELLELLDFLLEVGGRVAGRRVKDVLAAADHHFLIVADFGPPQRQCLFL